MCKPLSWVGARLIRQRERCHLEHALARNTHGWRLVARMRTPRASFKRTSARTAMASKRCSQLSRIRSASRLARCVTRSEVGHSPDRSATPRLVIAALATRWGSWSPARSTNQTPSRMVRRRSTAARKASRVLPTPPGPTKVSSLVRSNAVFTSTSNRRRPTKVVDSAGRLPAPARLAAGT